MNRDDYTISELHLEVNQQHTLYVQEWGNPEGMPIVYLHGGPGGYVKDSNKQLFDPRLHRVIFFDQRGCGQSLPLGSIEDNTTTDLIEDISSICNLLEITSFTLVGSSWGSCLALAYALNKPERIKSMVLHGIFTGSKAEIDWVASGAFRTFYPEAWQKYLAATPKEHRDDPSAYHLDRILNGNNEQKKKSGHAFQSLEGSILRLDDRFTPVGVDDFDPAGVAIEAHYLANNCFLDKDFILKHAARLQMPIVIVQGRYDMVCPPKTAFKLHETLPNSQLIMTLSGHIKEHEDFQLLRHTLRSLATAA